MKLCLAAFVALAVSMGATAQQKGAGQRTKLIQGANGEVTLPGTGLHFTGEKATKFIDTYGRFSKEIADASKEVKAVKQGRKLRDMSDAAIDSLMKARFRHSRDIMAIREKYYDEFRKFLTPREVQKVYDGQAGATKHAKRMMGMAKRRVKARQ